MVTQTSFQDPAQMPSAAVAAPASDGVGLLDLVAALVEHRRLLLIVPTLVGALALGGTYLQALTFTARTTFVPPQQSSNSSALASLGALVGGLPGTGALKTPADQYVTMMRSVTFEDRIVDRFKMMELYGAKYRFAAREALARHVRIAIGKKDNFITIEADADSPALAADIANQYVAELRKLSSELAITEAQQRRAFYESELKASKAKLDASQAALQSSGFSSNALKAEPKATADNYARVKAELAATEVRLSTLRRSLADNTPEIQQQLGAMSALRGQLAQLERNEGASGSTDYVSRYRDFKYQESLHDLLAKQYEMARIDESRENSLIQVLDVATPPEYKSGPRRASTTLGAAAASALIVALGIFFRELMRHARRRPETSQRLDRIRAAWRR